MTEVWALPGYDVQSLIGSGATGEVWRARELATGEPVALKRLRADVDPVAVEALRREAALLRSLDTPYVVRLRAVLDEGAETVLVLDLAAGGSLAALLARRGRLDPGEVVTVAAPLAQALAAAHARGLVHGDVTPSNVLFTGDGMPLLADLGVARIAGERLGAVDGTADYVDPVVAAGGIPAAASDVWALAAVCHRLLAPTAPRQLVSAVEQALQADPAARPDAAAFAAALRRSHAAAPVRLTGVPPAAPAPDVRPTHGVHDAPSPAPFSAARWTPPRALLIGTGAVLMLALAAIVGWPSGRSDPTGPAELATVVTSAAAIPSALPEAAPDWPAILDRLDAARAAAFDAADAGRLPEAYAPGSPGLAADAAAMARLHAAGQTARGVRHTVRRVTQTAYDGRTARLRVVDVLAAYDIVARDGSVVSRTTPRGEVTFVVRLVTTSQGWRLRQVTPG